MFGCVGIKKGKWKSCKRITISKIKIVMSIQRCLTDFINVKQSVSLFLNNSMWKFKFKLDSRLDLYYSF